jgi:hypothetical protein
MTTVESKLSDQLRRPRRRWQFSLGQLFSVLTVVCLVLASLRAYGWASVIKGTLLGVLLAFLSWELWLVVIASFPARRTLIAGLQILVPLGLMAGLAMESNWVRGMHGLLEPLVLLAAPPAWLTAWCVWRVSRRTPGDFELREVRKAATAHLILLAAFYLMALVLKNIARGDAAVVIATAGSFFTSVPWIRLLREKAMRNRPAGTFADYVSGACLLFSLIIVVIWVSVGSSLHSNRGYNLGFGIILILVFHSALPLGSIIWAIGMLIQLWRNRWHPILSLIEC